MHQWLADLLAAVALAFGTTAFTTFSVRSEDSPRLVGATFIWSVPVIFLIFFRVDLPPVLTMQVALGGFGIGLVSCAGLAFAHFVEQRMDEREDGPDGPGLRVYDLAARRHTTRRRRSPLRDRPI